MVDSPNAMLEKTIEVAVVAHAGQTDKNGEAYILHPLRVMQAVRDQGGSIEQQVAAVLHGVIEVGGVPDDFLAERFPAAVCDLVDALTKAEGEDYEAFLRRLVQEPGAALIKFADMNEKLGQMDLVHDESVRAALTEKYERGLAYLEPLLPAQVSPLRTPPGPVVAPVPPERLTVRPRGLSAALRNLSDGQALLIPRAGAEWSAGQQIAGGLARRQLPSHPGCRVRTRADRERDGIWVWYEAGPRLVGRFVEGTSTIV